MQGRAHCQMIAQGVHVPFPHVFVLLGFEVFNIRGRFLGMLLPDREHLHEAIFHPNRPGFRQVHCHAQLLQGLAHVRPLRPPRLPRRQPGHVCREALRKHLSCHRVFLAPRQLLIEPCDLPSDVSNIFLNRLRLGRSSIFTNPRHFLHELLQLPSKLCKSIVNPLRELRFGCHRSLRKHLNCHGVFFDPRQFLTDPGDLPSDVSNIVRKTPRLGRGNTFANPRHFFRELLQLPSELCKSLVIPLRELRFGCHGGFRKHLSCHGVFPAPRQFLFESCDLSSDVSNVFLNTPRLGHGGIFTNPRHFLDELLQLLSKICESLVITLRELRFGCHRGFLDPRHFILEPLHLLVNLEKSLSILRLLGRDPLDDLLQVAQALLKRLLGQGEELTVLLRAFVVRGVAVHRHLLILGGGVRWRHRWRHRQPNLPTAAVLQLRDQDAVLAQRLFDVIHALDRPDFH
mmetsp:Transcript_53519/g.174207  ORF Transcript_53519/g.174207 Transcript_53519/m.174207 type:complete len:457 (+) Transcript_53519:684-2054(+)